MTLTEVTKEEFFAAIGPQDCHPRIEGRWPYTSIFEKPDRREVGRIVDDEHETARYLLVEAERSID